MTPEQIAAVEFKRAVRGYDVEHVDEVLDAVADEVARLRRELSSARARLAAAGADPDRDLGAEAREDAERVRAEAQELADRMVAEARAEAQRLVGAARGEAQELVGSARGEAERLVGAARGEADDVVGSARTEADAVVGGARSEAEQVVAAAHEEARSTRRRVLDADDAELRRRREALERHIASLQAFEASYHERLRGHLENELALLEQRVAGGESVRASAERLLPDEE